MCGIAGYIYLDRQRPVDPATLRAMAAIIHHRGPDGYGWAAPPDTGVGFSHARLSIIDLVGQRGKQPFTREMPDGNTLLMAHNGEFYDFQRLRANMTAHGERFHSKSDSELIIHLYPELGLQGMMKHLRGEFAFALYDQKNDRLMLVRDRFGIKPLYYANQGDMIAWGSEIKAIFAHSEIERAFDPQGVFHQLMQTIVPGSTPYKNVYQVEPGHALIVERRDGRFVTRQERYWDMPFPESKAREAATNQDENHYIELIRSKLLEAVQHRLVADVPVGCYLSGGIDSCSILGLSAAVRQDPVKAFTIGFDSNEYDESAIATEMAQSVQADQDILRLAADHLYDHFVETHWHTERTIYNTLGVAKMLMSRHVRNVNYKVVVTGEGSDELFAGYPSFRRDMFLHGLHDLPQNEREEWQRMLNESNELFKGAMLAEDETKDPALEALCGFTPSCLQPWLAVAPRVPDLLEPSIRKDLQGYSPGKAIAAKLDPDAFAGRHPLDIAQYVWIKTMLEGQILTWGGDRVDMANSMEARPAFLDHHLAEAACTVPPRLRIKGRVEKYVLREAMKGLLPKVLYEREKFAFMAPPAHTDQNKMNAMRALAADYLSREAIESAGVLDPEGVARLFAVHDHPETSASTMVQLDAVINHMLGVQILHRNLIAANVPKLADQKAHEHGWIA